MGPAGVEVAFCAFLPRGSVGIVEPDVVDVNGVLAPDGVYAAGEHVLGVEAGDVGLGGGGGVEPLAAGEEITFELIIQLYRDNTERGSRGFLTA